MGWDGYGYRVLLREGWKWYIDGRDGCSLLG